MIRPSYQPGQYRAASIAPKETPPLKAISPNSVTYGIFFCFLGRSLSRDWTLRGLRRSSERFAGFGGSFAVEAASHAEHDSYSHELCRLSA
jgi:hypothetical protein